MERENERLTASSVEGSVGCLRGVGAGSPEGDLVQMGLDRSTGGTGKKGGHRPWSSEQARSTDLNAVSNILEVRAL